MFRLMKWMAYRMHLEQTKFGIYAPLINSISQKITEVLVILDQELNVIFFNDSAENYFSNSEIPDSNSTITQFSKSRIESFFHKNRDKISEINHQISLQAPSTSEVMLWNINKIELGNDILFLLTYQQPQDKNLEVFRLQTLIENMPCNIYWMDKDCLMVGCNHNVLNMLGLTMDEFVGKSYEELATFCHWPPGLAEKLKNDDLTVIHSGKPIFGIEDPPIIHVDGSVSNFLTSRVPIFDFEHKVIGVAGISVDITDLKKAKAATIVSEAKAEAESEMRKTVMVLVGDIVHDLRTPIATIRTITNLMANLLPSLLEISQEAIDLGAQKTALISKKKWEFLQELTPITSLQNSVVMMDAFINTTLAELSAAQSPEITNETLTKCSSRRIVENTLEAYVIPKEIVIHQEIRYEFFFMANSIIMMKILFNLIKNAIDQINLNGKGEITISTESAGEMNIMRIKDTAGGAPPEVVSKLFSGYFTTKKNGTGIGLAYCKNTMSIFGGDITVRSVYGESMEFILSFPKIK